MKSNNTAIAEISHIDSFIESTVGSKCSHKYELIYFVSGNGGIKIEGSLLPFEKETIYLLKPLAYYEICEGDGEDIDRYHISFSSSCISEDMYGVIESLFYKNNACAIIKDFSPCELNRAFSGFSFADKLTGDVRNSYLSAIIQQILVILAASEKKRSFSSSNELASKVVDFISESLESDRFPTLDDIAKTFFVSKFYLCRVFKNYSGTSIHAYINKKRVMKAKQYMDLGISAKSAALAVGYQDYSAFYRAYIKIIGSSPKSGKGE